MKKFALTFAFILLANAANAQQYFAAVNYPILKNENLDVELVNSTADWSQNKHWADVKNQAAGAAYSRQHASGNRAYIEAMSICHPGFNSNHKAASKAVYRWKSEFEGLAFVKPVGLITGKLISYGPLAGNGSADAKVTFTVRDVTKEKELLNTTIFNATSPSVLEKLTKGEEFTDKYDDIALGGYHLVDMKKGHIYEAVVKLWVGCWTYGFYAVRVDFSRHSPKQIGMVQVDHIAIRPFPGFGRYDFDNFR